MYIFCGFKRKTGSFPNEKTGELISYDNLELYLLSDDDETVTGNKPIIAGAKFADFKVHGVKDLSECIGREVYPIADLDQRPDENGRYKLLVKVLMVV